MALILDFGFGIFDFGFALPQLEADTMVHHGLKARGSCIFINNKSEISSRFCCFVSKRHPEFISGSHLLNLYAWLTPCMSGAETSSA